MQRFLIDRPGPSPVTAITEFYREEFIKHQRCLQEQREYFSSQAIESVESALIRVQAEQRVQRVNLHLALGGSFAPSP